MQRFLTLFSPRTIRTTLRLLRNYEILKLRTNNGYRPFNPATFIRGLVLGSRTMCRFIRRLTLATGYMSTRIADKPELGWTFNSNIALGTKRVAKLPPNTINPATDKMPFASWTPTEHMVFWVWVIVVLSEARATFYHFREDVPGSTGCVKELAMARALGMPIVPLP